MPGIDYHQLRQRVSMTEVLELVGFRATRRRDSQLRGLCPIPGCPSASGPDFSVHLDRQIYHCFACHSQGNALDLWATIQRLPLHPASIALCHALNITPPWLPTRSRSIPRPVE
jgi:DNA primase